MENTKKQQNFSRPINSKSCQSADSKRKSELQASKLAFPRAARRRDQQLTGPRNDSQRSSKQLSVKQRPYVDKRPRARGGISSSSNSLYAAEGEIPCPASDDILTAGAGLDDDGVAGAIDTGTVIGELNDSDRYTLQMCNGSGKRKNLNHLLNFQYAPREQPHYLGGGGIYGVFGSYGGGAVGKKHQQQHKYNKEQFLQANFQFVIKSNAKLHLITSADTIIDWPLIEQINIQTTEEPRCPICLYPPVAAKLTRCGHVYCWPCILHYLALHDKSWRKCPICYEAIHVADLKSTTILQQNQFNVGDKITFQLMRRKKGSFFVEKFTIPNVACAKRYPQYSGTSDLKPFSKFLMAKRSDILTIIERERAELLADEDTTCPEYVFVQQALNLLNERREKLGEILQHSKDDDLEIETETIRSNMERHDFDNISYDGNFEVFPEEPHLANTLEIKDVISTSSDKDQDDSNALIASNIETAHSSQEKYYFFYQCFDGQNIFLHPLNVKMLQACYSSLEYAPVTVNARIIQKECHSMDEDLRRKFTCLGHLPLTCQFAVVEIDLQIPIVTQEIISLFKDDIRHRRMERERRDKEERKREKKIAIINDRQMGKLISKTANINLSSALEFPVCGFDYDLMPALGATVNSFSTSKFDVNPVGTTSTNVFGTPPGPSYSSVIMSNDAAKVNNGGLFPELSIKGKGKKNNAPPSALTPNDGINPAVPLSDKMKNESGDSLKCVGSTFGDFIERAIVRKKTPNSKSEMTSTKDNNILTGAKKNPKKKSDATIFT